jgi:hypothetical protein
MRASEIPSADVRIRTVCEKECPYGVRKGRPTIGASASVRKAAFGAPFSMRKAAVVHDRSARTATRASSRLGAPRASPRFLTRAETSRCPLISTGKEVLFDLPRETLHHAVARGETKKKTTLGRAITSSEPKVGPSKKIAEVARQHPLPSISRENEAVSENISLRPR